VEVLTAALGRVRSPRSRSALRAALSEHARVRTQQFQRERLQDEVNGRVVNMPYLFADQVGLPELSRLADVLADQLDRGKEAAP
jgi:hypothetical protein